MALFDSLLKLLGLKKEEGAPKEEEEVITGEAPQEAPTEEAPVEAPTEEEKKEEPTSEV